MMGQHERTESLFYYFRLEDQIPEDHLLRLIDQFVDLSFVRERLKPFYSSTGRPSIDPEVLLRLLLIGNGTNSLRQMPGNKTPWFLAMTSMASRGIGRTEFGSCRALC